MKTVTKGTQLVDAYIAQFNELQQTILQQLRALILATIPEIEETISYKMPTYKYRINIFYFAMYKKHLGIYPGSEAIEKFETQLSPYKTSKGAIQLPLDEPLPVQLLQDILLFNKELYSEMAKPDWKKYEHQWTDATEKMLQLMAKTPLEKTFKWGGDVFTYNDKNVISFGGFKHHFAVWFYNGVFLKDEAQHLIAASDGKTKSLRQWRFASAQAIDEKEMLAYIKEAIQLVKDGIELPTDKSSRDIKATGFLLQHLNEHPEFAAAFYNLTPGRQKDYVNYIEKAKQEKTKISRIAKITPLILQGIGLNDKYKKQS